METDESYSLSLVSADRTASRADRILSMRFHPGKSILAAGTAQGRVVMWRHHHRQGDASDASDWEPLRAIQLHQPVSSLAWAGTEAMLSCVLPADVAIMNETVRCAHSCDGTVPSLSIALVMVVSLSRRSEVLYSSVFLHASCSPLTSPLVTARRFSTVS